jgi:hypothetical protein
VRKGRKALLFGLKYGQKVLFFVQILAFSGRFLCVFWLPVEVFHSGYLRKRLILSILKLSARFGWPLKINIGGWGGDTVDSEQRTVDSKKPGGLVVGHGLIVRRGRVITCNERAKKFVISPAPNFLGW